jgi:hypothetical protein
VVTSPDYLLGLIPNLNQLSLNQLSLNQLSLNQLSLLT